MSTLQVAVIAAQYECDQSRGLIHAVVQKGRNIEAILGEGQRRHDDHLSLFQSFFEMFRYDVNWALKDYFLTPGANVL